MIRVVYLVNPFDARAREIEALPWRPGMTVDDAIPPRLTRRDTLTVRRNGHPAALADELADGDAILVGAMPTDPFTATALGKSLASVGTSISTWWGGLFPAAKFILGAAALNIASRLLAPSPPGRRRGDETSPTYGFSGPGNIRVEGQPIPIVYGRFRVAGTILNEFVRTTVSPPQSDYYALVSFGEGPVYSIAGETVDTPRGQSLQTGGNFPEGIQLNGNAADSLDDIAVAVRLGTIEQDLVSDDVLAFDDTEQGTFIGSTLQSVETTSTDNSAQAFDNSTYTTSTADDHFDAYGVSYSFTSDFDAFRLLVNFPGGLYRINSSGGTTSSRAVFGVRYIELDGGGSPIASGGPEGDGYVRLPLPPATVLSQRNPFTLEIPHVFYDPQTYTHPAGGRALVLDGVNDTATTASTSGAPGGGSVAAMSFSAWIKLDTSGTHVIAQWKGSNTGFRFRAIPGITGFMRLELQRGTGTFDTTVTTPSFGGVPVGQWTLVAFSITSSLGSTDELRIWVNNSQQMQPQSWGNAMSSATTTGFQIGIADGLVDEVEWRRTALTQQDINHRYNGGLGRSLYPPNGGVAGGDVIALWHMDSTGADATLNSNDLTLNNGANIPAGLNGLVLDSTPSTATPKRSRYRVEVVRVNEDSTAIEVSDEAVLAEVYGVTNEEYSYPLSPILAIRARASEQLNTSKPTVTALVEGRLCPIWDGISLSTPDFYSEWTRNPAWIALDLILNRRYGMGQHYSGADVGLQSFTDLAAYCDEKVYDHQGEFEATADWDDATYTGASGVGEIMFQFTAAGYESLRWSVGDYVGVSGAPVVAEDINSVDLEGYEITEMDSAAYTVTVAVELPGDPWTSGTLLSASATVTGTLEGREPRYTFDGVLDTARPAWEQLMDVLAVARAIPIREGKRIRVKWEHPRSAVDIIGQAQIAAGSWVATYAGKQGRANTLTLEIHDENLNYDRVPVYVESRDIQNVSSLDKIRFDSMFLWGCTRRSQAMRHGAFLINVNDKIVREGRFRCGVDAVAWEVGDVLIAAHDVMPWGASGRISTQESDTSVQLGERTTLEAATTYELVIRNSVTGVYESREVTSSAGTYEIADSITVASAYSFTPTRDDPYVLCVQGEERRIQITEISTTQQMERDVAWVEYDATVYEDDWFGDIDAPTPDDAPSPSPLMLPDDPDGVSVQEVAVRGPGGNYVTTLQVSWDLTPSRFVAATAVHLSIDGGPFEQVAMVSGRASHAEVPVARSVPGQSMTVAVQPITTQGVKRRVEACANAGVTIQGVSLAPDAPASIVARTDGDLAAYSITEGDPSFAHEIRRGGWILGDPVVTLAPGLSASQAIANWASAFNVNVGRLHCRALNTAGFYSAETTLDQSVTPAGARTVPSWITANNINWAVYADGWRTASAPPAGDPVLTGFQVHADGYLEFDGSALEATYETAYTAPAPTNAIRAYVECWWEAVQEHPLTIGEWTWALGDPMFQRWTLEGPTTVLEGETANCTLKAQIAIDEGSGFGDWQDVRSGAVYSLMDAKFRLVATRASTDYNLRIERFITRIRQQAFADTDTF
jgi:hypothetical protein